jgi:hypothetical protein
MTRIALVAAVVAALLTTACGGSGPEPQLGAQPGVTPPAGQTIVVVTAPTETDVQPGDSVRFSAQVTGTANTSVRWSVDEADGGTVDATGVYTAPASEGTYHVRAESVVASSGATAVSVKGGASSVVRVKKGAAPQPVTVAVDPATVTVPAGGSFQFAAAVSGTTTRSVTWTVQEGSSCGAITSAGLYSAPGAGATCTVVATSQADASRSASATVTVSPPQVVSVAVSPAATSVLAGGSVTFTATVTGTVAGQSSAVTWSVPAGAGSIASQTGAYVAPATAGTYVVTARAVADATRTGTASVTVTVPPPPPPAVAVSISPASVTLDACRGQVFTATVTNASNTAVTWSVVEAGAGTVTNGAYVAPGTPGTYHVMAVSQADPTRTAQATITVGAEKVLSVALNPGSGTVQANGQLSFSALVTTTCGTFAAQ